MAVINVTGQAPVIMLRPWAAEHAGGGVSTLSLAYSAFALGMTLTAAALGAVAIRRGRGVLIFGGIVAAGLCQAGMAWAGAAWQLLALQFGLGAAVMVYGVLWPAMLQERVPEAAMGRVAAIDEFGHLALYPAGIALTGFVTGAVGAGPVLAWGGALTAVVAALGMWMGRDLNIS